MLSALKTIPAVLLSLNDTSAKNLPLMICSKLEKILLRDFDIGTKIRKEISDTA